jgi:hypothetical protein
VKSSPWRTVVLSIVLALCACSKRSDPVVGPVLCPCNDAGAPVDPVLMAFLSRARTAHHLADGFEESHQLERAVDALRKVVEGPVPPGKEPAPEVREVLADTHARLADLASQLGRFDDAARHVDDGLADVPQAGYFRGHLFEVRGLLEERRAKTLRSAGNEQAAAQAEQRAVEASETSMAILAEVVKNAAPAAAPSSNPR